MQFEPEYQSGMYKLNIDEEFKRLHITMSKKRFSRLEQNINQRGPTKPILVWNGYIVDGHKRYDIYHRRNIPFCIQSMDLSCREEVMEWLCDHNLSQIELTEEYKKYFIGKKLLIRYSIFKLRSRIRNVQNNHSSEPQNKYLLALQMSQELGLAYVTILKYSLYAKAIDTIYEHEPYIAEQILTGEEKVSHKNVILLSQLPSEDLAKLKNCFNDSRYYSLISSDAWHDLNSKHTYSQSRQNNITNQPSAEIKKMPKYDPDAELLSLTLTIPMWRSSMERVINNTNIIQTSDKAKNNLINQLTNLSESIDQLKSFIKEGYDNGKRAGFATICTESSLRTDPNKESSFESRIPEKSLTETYTESSSQFRYLSDKPS